MCAVRSTLSQLLSLQSRGLWAFSKMPWRLVRDWPRPYSFNLNRCFMLFCSTAILISMRLYQCDSMIFQYIPFSISLSALQTQGVKSCGFATFVYPSLQTHGDHEDWLNDFDWRRCTLTCFNVERSQPLWSWKPSLYMHTHRIYDLFYVCSVCVHTTQTFHLPTADSYIRCSGEWDWLWLIEHLAARPTWENYTGSYTCHPRPSDVDRSHLVGALRSTVR